MGDISVIVPVYKVEKYLKRCIDSILEQTFHDFDLILVDDGSPDYSGCICEEYAKKDKRIIVLHRTNGGLSAARNTGLEWMIANSECRYVTFIDSDDWVHPQYLEILLKVIEKNNADVSVSGFRQLAEYSLDTINDFNIILPEEVLEPEDFFLSHEWNFNYAWGKLYRSKYFENIRYPEGKNFEDVFTTYKILFSGKTVAFVDIPLYYYFYNTEGISHSLWNPSELVVMEGIREQIKFYRDNGFYRALEKEKQLYVNHHAYQINRIRANRSEIKKNIFYLKKLRKNMFHLIRQNPDKYGYRKMPQCYEAAYPRLMKIYHGVGWLLHKLTKG